MSRDIFAALSHGLDKADLDPVVEHIRLAQSPDAVAPVTHDVPTRRTGRSGASRSSVNPSEVSPV